MERRYNYEKKRFGTALSNQKIVDDINRFSGINIIINIICTAVLFGLYNMRIERYKLYFVLVSCIVIYIDILVGFIVRKFIKTKHKTLLLLLIIKYFMFVYTFFFFSLVLNFVEGNTLKIHMIIFVILNIIFIPINIKSLNKKEGVKQSKLSIIIGSLIPISGIIGMWVSRFFRSTGNYSFAPILVFYLATFIAIIMQKIFIVFIWQYRNYERVYTKELVDNWIRLDKKSGEDDPKRSYY